MGDTIKIKRGSLGKKTEMSKLADGELGYVADKKELYIGTPSGNVRLCGAGDHGELSNYVTQNFFDLSKKQITAQLGDIVARLEALEKSN